MGNIKEFFKDKPTLISITLIVVGLVLILYNFLSVVLSTQDARSVADEALDYYYKDDDVVVEDLGFLTEDQEVMDESEGVLVLSIPSLGIRAPITNGTGKNLSNSVGWFEQTSPIGESGNFAIAGHSHPIYKSILNGIENISIGDRIDVYDKNGEKYTYYTSEVNEVSANSVSVLDDFGDDRITIVTCTKSGLERRIIVGLLLEGDEYRDFLKGVNVVKRAEVESLLTDLSNMPLTDIFSRKSVTSPRSYKVFYLEYPRRQPVSFIKQVKPHEGYVVNYNLEVVE